MKLPTLITVIIPLFFTSCAADLNLTAPLSSHQILPNTFKPPQVFKNVNLLRNINLEKSYVKETINVVIENTDAKPQDEYYIPFGAGVIGKVGGLEVKYKKNPDKAGIVSEVVEYDTYRSVCVVSLGISNTDHAKPNAVLPSHPSYTSSALEPRNSLDLISPSFIPYAPPSGNKSTR